MTEQDGGTGRCELCEEPVPGGLVKLIDHLRVLHPEEYGDGPERWPDGGIVVLDESLTPDEFGGAV